MRIGINGRHLGRNKTGVGRYLLSLLQQWHVDGRGHEFFVYTSGEELQPADVALFSPGSRIQHRPLARPFGSFHLWYNFSLPQAMRRDRIDWFFSPDYFCPPFLPRSIRRSMSIHDISFVTNPEWSPWTYRLSVWPYSRWPAGRADLIFTISQFSSTEIQRHYRLRPDKIIVTPLAADSRYRPPEQPDKLNVPGLTGPYFLFVGKMMQRRHVREMLLAFDQYRQQNPANQTQFVIRGDDETHPPQRIAELISVINQKLSRPGIVTLDYVSEEELVSLYQRTAGFFYLSTYEGFGLPVLEALACGAPTVTVRATSIPEVAGEAAIYVDPANQAELVATMARLINDSAWRADKRQQALAQAQKYNWAAVAQKTLANIERVYTAPHS